MSLDRNSSNNFFDVLNYKIADFDIRRIVGNFGHSDSEHFTKDNFELFVGVKSSFVFSAQHVFYASYEVQVILVTFDELVVYKFVGYVDETFEHLDYRQIIWSFEVTERELCGTVCYVVQNVCLRCKKRKQLYKIISNEKRELLVDVIIIFEVSIERTTAVLSSRTQRTRTPRSLNCAPSPFHFGRRTAVA